MNQQYGKFFLLAMIIMAIGLGLNACSDDDPVTPPGGGDQTAPTLVGTAPADGATDLDINQVIIATFSEPMDQTTLNGNITISPGLVTDLIMTGNEIQIVHNPFNRGDEITITFAVGLTDTAGNHLAAPVSNQYTVVQPDSDTTAPVLVSTVPIPGTTGLDVNQTITAVFSENLALASLNGNISISPGTVTDLILDGNEVEIVHNPFAEGEEIAVTFAVGLTDTAGNHLAAPVVHNYWVATSEVTVVEHFPTDGTIDFPRNVPVSIKFNQDMNTLTLEAGITASVPDKADLEFSVSTVSSGTYELHFDEDLPSETEVTVTIGTSCESPAGFTLAAPVVFSFQTSAVLDVTPPQIISFQPASGSTVSAYNSSLVITFDKPVNPESLQLLRADIVSMLTFQASEIGESWNEDNTVFTAAMATPLAPGTTMTLQFQDFEDHLGNINTTHPTWSITIEGDADFYPVDEDLVYIFDFNESGDRAKDYNPLNIYRNVWSSTDHFMHQRFDSKSSEWNEWDNMIRTATTIDLDGFREYDEGIASDVTFDHALKFLNNPMTPESWTDNIVVTTGEGDMAVTFSAEVLPSVAEFPFEMSRSKMALGRGILDNAKSFQVQIFFPECRTIIQQIEGSVDGSVEFTSMDTLVYCPGFGLIQENSLEDNQQYGERYSTSKIIGLEHSDMP